MVQPPKELRSFESLLEIVAALRGPDGCPWDKEQTPQTLTRYAIEEAHELVEAVEKSDWTEVQSELGDLLLQVALHAQIAKEDGRFDIFSVLQTLNEKMVRRHPHVFAEVSAASSAEVLVNWEQIKAQEKAAKLKGMDSGQPSGITSATPSGFDLPKSLPALMMADKIGAKTKKNNFDWPGVEDVWQKLVEEIGELKAEIPALRTDAATSSATASRSQSIATQTEYQRERIRSELGDVLFTVAQLARHLEVDPEQALRETNRRFEGRYFKMLSLIKESNLNAKDLAPSELEAFWQKAKQSF